MTHFEPTEADIMQARAFILTQQMPEPPTCVYPPEGFPPVYESVVYGPRPNPLETAAKWFLAGIILTAGSLTFQAILRALMRG